MIEAQWSHFPHSADIGVRGEGPSLAAAFEQAALALFSAMTDLRTVASRDRVTISCAAPNHALLFLDWLNALIFEATTRKMLFSRFSVTFPDRDRLEGYAWGEPIDLKKHGVAVEPKGATFTELRVGATPAGGWYAQCVVDV